MENVKSCSLAELENMEQETYQLLDIRSMEAFDHGHLKDALNIPANELIFSAWTASIPGSFFAEASKKYCPFLLRYLPSAPWRT